ncbi:DUF1616 domain-containing protein [Natrarchaeobius chitinivorans]|uniref:DUF1616 domain-containing protein n=1 Tax=Natrarchaeobius chitinivorans TaxID=1679083 RepID=A0A3N6LNM7_NATCH|nr:DUF1616 domain-containing protein [Natrarchaeobius chitinivorans]RQG90978.1 DUF1616 domain-containing protein [Natrarchaeobius chitinivorans]
MTDDRLRRVLLPRPLRAIPADLVAVLACTVTVNAATFLPVVRETPLGTLLGVLFFLVVPGYALVAAAFPGAGDSRSDLASKAGASRTDSAPKAGGPRPEPDASGLDTVERVALSLAASVAVVPLLVLPLEVTPWEMRLGPIMTVTSGFVLVSTAAAVVRRWHLPPERRFRVRYREWTSSGWRDRDGRRRGPAVVLLVVLIGSVAILGAAASVAVLAPIDGEGYSSIYVLSGDSDDVSGYPSSLELASGERHELTVGVDNEEHRAVEYAVVVVEQRVDRTGDSVTVTDQRELERFEVELNHGERWRHGHEVAPTMDGEGRIVWLLYPDGAPDEPTIERAGQYVSLPVTVAEPDD